MKFLLTYFTRPTQTMCYNETDKIPVLLRAFHILESMVTRPAYISPNCESVREGTQIAL